MIACTTHGYVESVRAMLYGAGIGVTVAAICAAILGAFVLLARFVAAVNDYRYYRRLGCDKAEARKRAGFVR